MTAPSFTSPALINGEATFASTLTCVPGAIVGERVATTFAWLRDGTPIAGATGATYRAVGADVHHAIACRVTATNPIGSATQTSRGITIVPEPGGGASSGDRDRPSVKLLTPACPRKTSRKACARLRARARSWRTLHGTVSDPKPSSGIARVEVNIVRTRGKTCTVYNGKRFAKASCKTAAKRYVRAKLGRGGRWTLTLRTLPAGTYTIRVRATDKARNTTAKPMTRKLRLR